MTDPIKLAELRTIETLDVIIESMVGKLAELKTIESMVPVDRSDLAERGSRGLDERRGTGSVAA